MEARLIALKLFLDELEVSASIETIDDRKRVQKAVYLGQLTGVDLGYHFGWYLKGPYSSNLTKDYYELAEAIEMKDNDFEGKVLRQSIKEGLKKITPLLNPPKEIDLSQEDWLELVASLHYLRKVSKQNEEKAHQTFQTEKPHLVLYLNQAKAKLQEVELLN